MRDVIDGLKNHSTREAKDFVVSRLVEEAHQAAQHRKHSLPTKSRTASDLLIRGFVLKRRISG